MQRYRADWCSFLLLWVILILGPALPLKAQVLPLEQKNTITADWLVYEPGTARLVPYVAGMHTGYKAIHQWLSVSQAQPFVIGFTAQKGLCLFLNNQLIFKADATARYTLDITQHTSDLKPVAGKYLLTVWHPEHQPNVNTFRNQVREENRTVRPDQRPFTIRARDYINQNAFILFMLLIGLIYGWLKTSYPAEFGNIFRLGAFDRSSSAKEAFLMKPVRSWSSVLFVLAFSLTMALLIAAIHTNVQHIRLFNRLFPVSQADITTKIVFYTFLVFVVILLKYLFLKVMGFIFGLEQVVQVQYREFIRTLLFLGMFLPGVLLLYLALNASSPEAILLVSNLAVSLLLIFTVLRVFASVNKKVPVLNLHLFSYLCATEVIPLAIMLKLIVFNF
nr:DUF4271 domain-containing protein [Pontibacter sp. 172403-2]